MMNEPTTITRTTRILSNEGRERLLDRFPLSDDELDVLMDFRQRDSPFFRGPNQDELSSALKDCFEFYALWSWALGNSNLDDDMISSMSSSSSLPREHAVFLEAAVTLLGRRGEAVLHRALFQCQPDKNMDAVAQFLFQLVRMDSHVKQILEQQQQQQETVEGTAKAVHFETSLHDARDVAPPPGSWIASLRTMAHKTSENNNETLSWPAFHGWITECAPWLHTVVPSLFHSVWFGSNREHFRPGQPWSLPQFMVPTDWNMAFSHSKLGLVAPLAAMLGPGRHLYGIYSSDEQGLHFGTLQQALSGYIGPTLTLVGTTTQQILGYYTQAPWMTGAKAGWHGNMVLQEDGSELSNQAFLCTLTPTWQMFPRTYDDSLGGLQWLKMAHTSRTSMPYSGLAVGGMHPDAPRLLLTESLEQCQSMMTDRPFTSGCLVPCSSHNGKDNYEVDEECVLFDVEWIDLYAVVESHDQGHANSSSRAEFEKRQAAGQKLLQTREWHRQKAAYVDKKQFVDDFANGIYDNGRLYAHRRQSRGRADFVVADDESKGYFIDEKQPSKVLSSQSPKNP